MRTSMRRALGALLLCVVSAPAAVHAQVAVRGDVVHTLTGAPIRDGMVIVRDGKIAAVGAAADLRVPEGFEVLHAAVVTPGLVDAHSVVGLAGQFNIPHDQDQLEPSTAMQPELRALDAYNARERLVEWIRGFGVTTIHTGHAPGQLISGQTMVVKTAGDTVEDALVVPARAIAATLAMSAQRSDTPGTRGKMMALLRARFLAVREVLDKPREEEQAPPSRNLGDEAIAGLLRREMPLLVTAQHAQDISNALRLAKEFDLDLILDGAAEAYLLVDEIRAAGVPVIVHPPMARTTGELGNASFETAATLKRAGIPVALQSGFESYVPKTRVVLFEAAIAATNGLTFDEALATITIDAARILRIDDRVGSLSAGKDGDLALFDGDPFEYTTHCTAVVIEGQVVSREPR